MKEEILDFMSNRPECVGIIGYGSGVFKQSGYKENEKPQIDLILIVEDIKKWSEKNIEINPNDYSATGKIYFKKASNRMLKSGGQISYITYVEHKGKQYKYGLIEKKDFLNSLTNWNTFYLSGRCQKNNLIVKGDSEILYALYYNRYAALVLSIFLNKDKREIKEYDLYKTICSLSYIGDTRQGIAENPFKIDNILKKDFLAFRKMYSIYNLYDINPDGTIKIKFTGKEICDLPDCIFEGIISKTSFDDQKNEVIKILSEKNRKESLSQTFKGILSSGIVNSVNYGFQKVKKARKKSSI